MESYLESDENPVDAAKSALFVKEDGSKFLPLLEYLKRSRGFDFSGYKRTSLMRRIEKRMQMVGVAEYGDYIDYLEVHPDEFGHLFNMILINVTAFFRDPLSWEYISQEVVPRLLAEKSDTESIRIWSAGCASGEEPYTLAIILAEALGFDEFRKRVKLYATDIDEEALAQARQASYSEREVAGIPGVLLEKYFEKSANRYVFHKDLRRALIFGSHDLLKDAPISRIDLLVCRNTLMYFNSEVQAQVLQRFHFALNETGCLFLGKAEMLFTHANLFAPLELKRRIFSLVLKGTPRERTGPVLQRAGVVGPLTVNSHTRIQELVFDSGPIAEIVVDLNGNLTMANEKARGLFRLSPRDIGRVLQDLEVSYRPVELRSKIEMAYAERRTIDLKEIVWQPAGAPNPLYFDVQVVPLSDGLERPLGVKVAFADVSRYRRLQQELEESSRELETAYEELQSTNEELETTNEELQSTVEELETTNEELQSTNEELETMNEELQSTNEELQTINEELQTRSAELNHANLFQASILSSLQSGVIVLDRDMKIKMWNRQSVEMWGLRPDEVQDKHLLNLDFGLPIDDLKAIIRTCLSGGPPSPDAVVEATNRRGRHIQCRVTCSPLGKPDDILGAILLMDEV